jgi:hypothetical protein
MPPFATFAPAIAKGVFGLAQSIFGGGARRRAERDLERHAQSYQVSPGILDYYNKALARYAPNPYQSQFYQQQQNQVGRNMAAGINAAQDRRSGLAAISRLNQQSNDALARAGVSAEQMQGQQLAQLGSAASMKNAAEQKKFDMLYNLKAMKAGQSATRENQGYQNIFGGLTDWAKLKYLDAGGSPTEDDSWQSKFMASNRRRGSILDEGTQFPGE